MGVGVERDVGERQPVGHEEPAAREMIVHHLQRRFRLRAAHRDLRLLLLAQPIGDERDPESHRRDIGFVAVLLEAHPAQHVRAVEPVVGDQG